MSEEETPRSDLALLLDLAAQLRQDQELDELTLRRRDRTIGSASSTPRS